MLTESDIVPGRFYLCRTNMPTIRGPHAGPREAVVLRAGSKQETAQGLKSELTLGGLVIGWVGDGSTEVLRELDLEAMAEGGDRQRVIDLRAMLEQVQSSYCAALASLECAKEHARQAIAGARAHVDPQTLLDALEDIVDGSPLPAECGASNAFSWDDVTETRYVPRGSKNQAESGVGLSHRPTWEWVRCDTFRSYHENLAAARRRLAGLLAKRGLSEPQAPRWSDEVEAEIERVAE